MVGRLGGAFSECVFLQARRQAPPPNSDSERSREDKCELCDVVSPAMPQLQSLAGLRDNQLANVAAVVLEVNPARPMPTRAGGCVDLSTLVIADPQCSSFRVALWAELAPLASHVGPGDTVVVLRMRVRSWRGSLAGSLAQQGKIINFRSRLHTPDPDVISCRRLQQLSTFLKAHHAHFCAQTEVSAPLPVKIRDCKPGMCVSIDVAVLTSPRPAPPSAFGLEPSHRAVLLRVGDESGSVDLLLTGAHTEHDEGTRIDTCDARVLRMVGVFVSAQPASQATFLCGRASTRVRLLGPSDADYASVLTRLRATVALSMAPKASTLSEFLDASRRAQCVARVRSVRVLSDTTRAVESCTDTFGVVRGCPQCGTRAEQCHGVCMPCVGCLYEGPPAYLFPSLELELSDPSFTARSHAYDDKRDVTVRDSAAKTACPRFLAVANPMACARILHPLSPLDLVRSRGAQGKRLLQSLVGSTCIVDLESHVVFDAHGFVSSFAACLHDLSPHV
jgi:hypothetical protein